MRRTCTGRRAQCATHGRTRDPTTDASDARRHLARNLAGLRHARALTQDALAKAAAVPRSTIANLESGAGNPSLAVLVKVAQALGVPIDELLASPRAHGAALAGGRGRDAQQGPRRDASATLVPEPVPDEMMEVMDFAPGAVMGGTPHLPGTREFFTCLTGRVNLTVAGDRHALNEGDVLAFPGNLPHSYPTPMRWCRRAACRWWCWPRPARSAEH